MYYSGIGQKNFTGWISIALASVRQFTTERTDQFPEENPPVPGLEETLNGRNYIECIFVLSHPAGYMLDQ